MRYLSARRNHALLVDEIIGAYDCFERTKSFESRERYAFLQCEASDWAQRNQNVVEQLGDPERMAMRTIWKRNYRETMSNAKGCS